MELKTKKIIAREFILICICVVGGLLVALSCILINKFESRETASYKNQSKKLLDELNAPPPPDIYSSFEAFDPFWTIQYKHISPDKYPQKFNKEVFLKNYSYAVEQESSEPYFFDNQMRILFTEPKLEQFGNLLEDEVYRDFLYKYIQRLKSSYISTLTNYDDTDQDLIVNWSEIKYTEVTMELVKYAEDRSQLRKDYYNHHQLSHQLMDSGEIIHYSLLGFLALVVLLFPVRLFYYSLRWSIKTLRK